MTEKLIQNLLKRKLFIILILGMLVVSGIFSYLVIPKQHFPVVVYPIASVTVIYPGASASDMEELVAKKIEKAVMDLDGFDHTESHSYANACGVSVVLDMDLSQEAVDKSFDDLRDKIEDMKDELPAGVTSVRVDTEVMDTAGMLLTVSSAAAGYDELCQRAGELRDQLEQEEGIQRIDLYGDLTSEIQVRVHTDALNRMNLSLTEIASVIVAANTNIPLGHIDLDGEKITVNTNGELESVEEIGNLIVDVSQPEGLTTRLADIADIGRALPDDEPYFRYNEDPAVLLAVYYKEDLNVVSLGDSIQARLEDFRNHTRADILVSEIFSQQDEVKNSINGFVFVRK